MLLPPTVSRIARLAVVILKKLPSTPKRDHMRYRAKGRPKVSWPDMQERIIDEVAEKIINDLLQKTMTSVEEEGGDS